jgi:hypothetical protein
MSPETPKQPERKNPIKEFFKGINIPMPEVMRNAIRLLTGQPNKDLGAAGTNIKQSK